MPRKIVEGSRRDLKEKDWKVVRVYITDINRRKLYKYQIDKNHKNCDIALNDILNKFFEDGGK